MGFSTRWFARHAVSCHARAAGASIKQSTASASDTRMRAVEDPEGLSWVVRHTWTASRSTPVTVVPTWE